MDDTNSNPKAQSVNQAGTLPVQPEPQAHQPLAPTGGTKEAPTGMPLKTEWVAPSSPEIVLPKEVQDAGVTMHPVIPEISESDRAHGVQMGHQNIPAPTVASESLGLTTPRSVLDHLKNVHKGVKESISWLVRLIMKEQDKNLDDR